MYQEKAETLARQFGGCTWMSGGGIWLTVVERSDGRVAVFSDECVCEYVSSEAFYDGERPLNTIAVI